MANAGDTMQILGFLRNRVALEKRRCSYDDRAHVRPNSQRYHVCFQAITEAHPGVKSSRHYVYKSIAFHELYFDIWIQLKKPADDWQQYQLTSLAACGDTQIAGGFIAKAIEIFKGVFDVSECGSQTEVQPLPRFSQGHTTSCSIEQAHA